MGGWGNPTEVFRALLVFGIRPLGQHIVQFQAPYSTDSKGRSSKKKTPGSDEVVGRGICHVEKTPLSIDTGFQEHRGRPKKWEAYGNIYTGIAM